jgi:hypothetical protein
MSREDEFLDAVSELAPVRRMIRESEDMDAEAVLNYIRNVRSEEAKERYRKNTTPEAYKTGLEKLDGIDEVDGTLAKAYAKASTEAV